jgi:hypothetical protein
MRTALDYHLALARIGCSLPLEVPIDMAARHESARDSAHRADEGSLALGRALGGGSRA